MCRIICTPEDTFLLAPFRFLPAFLLTLLWLQRRERSLCFQSLRFRNLRFHLHNQYLQFLLALLAGVGVNIAGVLFAVGPFRGIGNPFT